MLKATTTKHTNLNEAQLIEHALQNKEGHLGQGGCFMVSTGKFTGRSPKDKYVVKTQGTQDSVCWATNQAMTAEQFANLEEDMRAYMSSLTIYTQDLFAGADPKHRLNVSFHTEFAWHSLFVRHMFVRPSLDELETFLPDATVINLPSFKADPKRHGGNSDTLIALDLDQKLILIAGTEYAGENKKSIFSLLNHSLPEKGIFPMHCSATQDPEDMNKTAVFFGLSGTGKTTLSADPNRILIGDDEHGWTKDGVFNFEGGCYAKTIHLSAEAEPDIYATTKMFGTIVENMVWDPKTLALDFDDDSLTANMRCAYPIHAIPNASPTGQAGQVAHVIMLTCDAFGVLPPISRLTHDQAIYHFLSGFTAKMGGTERGVKEPQPTFSTCFGAPFMPRKAQDYAQLLRTRLEESGAQCWLINTGWSGGDVNTGQRMPIKMTRALLDAAMRGELNDAKFETHPVFGLDMPLSAPNVDAQMLNPRATWADKSAYDAKAQTLADMFRDNFKKFKADMDHLDVPTSLK